MTALLVPLSSTPYRKPGGPIRDMLDEITSHTWRLKDLAYRFDEAEDFDSAAALMRAAGNLVAAGLAAARHLALNTDDPDDHERVAALSELAAEYATPESGRRVHAVDGGPCTCETYGVCAPCSVRRAGR